MSRVEAAFCRSAPWRLVARRSVLPWVLGHYQLGGRVLEVGAGSGAMAEGVARRHPAVRLTVTDPDDRMVRVARSRLTSCPNVTVRSADVTSLPFAAGSYDAVTSFLMLHHVIAWPTALEEAFRVLRPGGRLIGYDLTDTPVARLIHRVDGSPHRLMTPGELAEGMSAAGFTDVEVHTSAAGQVMRFHGAHPVTSALAGDGPG